MMRHGATDDLVSRTPTRAGFSLVEVTLALVVVAMGLLGVFHLFPAGLRASADATAETRCAQFADEVFNQVYADAASLTNSATWAGLFTGDVDIQLASKIKLKQSTATSVRYPAGSQEYVRYTCDSIVNSAKRLASVELKVWYGQVGGFSQTFYTEVYNFGM